MWLGDAMDDDLSEERFAAYAAALVEVSGHADRAGPLRDYCLGLLTAGERKSVEPMAAVTAPARQAPAGAAFRALAALRPRGLALCQLPGLGRRLVAYLASSARRFNIAGLEAPRST
jgi:hypothetical protein